VTRIDVVRAALAATGGQQRYLEIGVKDGACFHAVDAPTKVGVDPAFAFRLALGARLRAALGRRSGTLYFEETSDSFFARRAARLAPFDVVFVDGLHTYDQAYRDVVSSLERLADGGVVLVHDSNPASAAAAAPTLEQAARTEGFVGEWNGDVYRAIVRLRTRDDLRVDVLDCDQGIGLVRRGVPDVRVRLSEAEIEKLTFDDLARDRPGLLGLRPPSDLGALLPASRT
jgi:hypothetical protein